MLLVFQLACQVAEDGRQARGGANGPPRSAVDTPAVRRISIPLGIDTLFWSAETSIGLLQTGEIVVLGPAAGNDAGRLHVVDPFTGSIRTGGRLGEGPGELSGSGVVISGTDWVGVADDGHGKLVLFDRTAGLLREIPLLQTRGLILATARDSIDVLAFRWDEGAEEPIIARFGMPPLAARIIVPDADTAVRGYVTGWQDGRRARRIPGYAVSDSLIAVADPIHYRIRLYRTSGELVSEVIRNISPARRSDEARQELELALRTTIREYGVGSSAGQSAERRLDSLDRERLPHFSWPGMGFDGADRLWAIGEEGDSTFADVFVDGHFGSRTMLPCARPRRRVAMRGNWIALHCEVRESESSPFELQLYQIDR